MNKLKDMLKKSVVLCVMGTMLVTGPVSAFADTTTNQTTDQSATKVDLKGSDSGNETASETDPDASEAASEVVTESQSTESQTSESQSSESQSTEPVVKPESNYYSVDTETATITMYSGMLESDKANAAKFNTYLNKAIKSASDKAKAAGNIYTVKVPAGTYSLDGAIHMYGNVNLDLTGVIINYTASKGNMIMVSTSEFNDSSAAAGYGTESNMTINGGYFRANDENTGCIARFTHCSNLTLNACSFVGGKCSHQIEVSAINGFNVTGCTFADMKKTSDTSGKYEALQLDICVNDATFVYSYEDGTPMTNVNITGNTFSNVPRGVGTHSMLIGSYHTNINISNNVFNNIQEEAIITCNYKNCTINNNTMTDVGAGITVQNYKAEYTAIYNTVFIDQEGIPTLPYTGMVDPVANTTISGNSITLAATSASDEVSGIKVYGRNQTVVASGTGDAAGQTFSTGDYYISNVTVTNNNINCSNVTKYTSKSGSTNGKSGIHLMDVRDSWVDGNIIEAAKDKFYGIYVEKKSTNIQISGNQIGHAGNAGIYLDSANASNITGNYVGNTSQSGIAVYNGSSVTNEITYNLLAANNANGISVNLNSTVGGISYNTVNSAKGYGVLVYQTSKVSGAVNSNTIIKSSQSGIYVGNSSKVADITSNTLKSVKGYGIILSVSSEATGDISSNTISKPGNAGIVINNKSKAKNVLNNTISRPAAGAGIMTSKSSYVKSNITGNVVSKAVVGISICATSKNTMISDNTIKKCKGYAISVAKSGKVRIGNNTISKNKINKFEIYGTKDTATATKADKAVTLSKIKLDDAGDPLVKWSAGDKVSGYIVEYSTSKSFKPEKIMTKKVGKKATSTTIDGLDEDTKYYVRVRSYKKVNGCIIYSEYSAKKSVRTE